MNNETAAPACLNYVATRHADGVTVDISLPPDDRDVMRRRAWASFVIGISTLMGALVWFGLVSMLNRAMPMGAWTVVFFAGLAILVLAARISTATWTDSRADNDLRQLTVAGNMLICTARDHRKQIWHSDEVRTIVVQDQGEHLDLAIELRNGEKAILIRQSHRTSANSNACAELESIAALLRQALAQRGPEGDISVENAITRPKSYPDTQITS